MFPRTIAFLLFFGAVVFLSIFLAKSFQNPNRAKVSYQYLQSELSKCLAGKEQKCYEILAINIGHKEDIPKILVILKEHLSDNIISQSCHLFSHYLGHEEYKKVKNLPTALNNCSNFCSGGCYHGVAEEYFKEKYAGLGALNEKNLKDDLGGFCTDFTNCQNKMMSNMVHGLGHVLMFLSDNDLLKTLKLCDDYTGNYRDVCYGGVFMDNSQNINNKEHPSKYVSADDPLYPCTILDKKYLKTCYLNQAENYFTDSIEKNLEFCQKIPADFQKGCFKILAKMDSYKTRDVTLLKKDCDVIEDEQIKKECVTEVVNNLARKYGDDYKIMVEFCRLVDIINKTSCYEEIKKSLDLWSDSGFNSKAICPLVEEKKYAPWCFSN